MWTKLQQHFHYTTATILAILTAAITLATTLGLNVSASERTAILQLVGLILGGIVVGGGVKSAGMLNAGVHPLQKAAARADLENTRQMLAALERGSAANSDVRVGTAVTNAEPGATVKVTLEEQPAEPIRMHPRQRGHGDHPILKVHGTFAGLGLGKAKPKLDARTPVLGEFMDARLGIKLPKNTSWLPPIEQLLGNDFGMMGNDTYGDCTCAALGHAIQIWTGTEGPPATLTTAQILDLYWKTGTEDDGRVMFEVLKYVHHHGLAGHDFGAYVSVGLRRYSHRDVRAAIDLFGGCYLGVMLPESAQTQAIWNVVGDPHKPGPAEGAAGAATRSGWPTTTTKAPPASPGVTR
jgi:hypothetical protein